MDPERITTDHLQDQWWRLNNLYYIIDKNGKKVLFRPNAVQKRMFDNLWYRNVVLKSRRHGITTFSCILMLDTSLFNDNQRCCLIAHNKDDAIAIFRDKIKYPYDCLPEQIKAVRPAITDRKQELLFGNNSSVRVTDSGRSGTVNILHISEMGRIAVKYPMKAREIVTGAFEAVHTGQVIIVESTAQGRGGEFFDLCDRSKKGQEANKQLTELDFEFHFYAWHIDKDNVAEDPNQVFTPYLLEYFEELSVKHGIKLTHPQKVWYAKKVETLQGDMKAEYPSTPEEAFEETIEGAYYRSQFRFLRQNGRITTVPYIDGVLVDTWWDLGMDDSMSIWFTQSVGRAVHCIDYYEHSGEGFAHYKDILDQRKYRYGMHFAPHDISVRELGTGKSRLEAARTTGISFRIAPRVEDKMDGIEQVRRLLSICWFDEERCSRGIDCLENYRKEWNEKTGTYRNQPLHDWAAHGADAFQTCAIGRGVNYGLAGQTPRRESVKNQKRKTKWI